MFIYYFIFYLVTTLTYPLKVVFIRKPINQTSHWSFPKEVENNSLGFLSQKLLMHKYFFHNMGDMLRPILVHLFSIYYTNIVILLTSEYQVSAAMNYIILTPKLLRWLGTKLYLNIL